MSKNQSGPITPAPLTPGNAPANLDPRAPTLSWSTPPHPSSASHDAPTLIYVRDVMSTDVVSVVPDAPLRTAVEILQKYGFSGLPVVDTKGAPAGVISEKDILRTLRDRAGLNYPKTLWDLLLAPEGGTAKVMQNSLVRVLDSARVQQAMSAPPIVIAPEATIIDATRTMVGRGINRLLVVEKGRLVGIVTRHDLLGSLRPES